MPLALLLAASWVNVLSPNEIFFELQKNYDLLQADWADLPERQRSMRASFNYSWRLMDERERSVYQALSVFRGSFTRQAAEQVSGTTLHELRTLVELSFLQHLPSGRYEMHDLLRQYAEEKLSASPAAQHETRLRHCAFFSDRLPEMAAGLKSARQADTLTLVDIETGDMRHAWDWAAERAEISRLRGGLEALCLYSEINARFTEGRSVCQDAAQALARLDSPEAHHLLAWLAAWESRFCRLQGEQALAQQRLEESQVWVDELVDSGLDLRGVQAMIHLEAGETCFTADLAATQRHLERSLALYRPLGDSWCTAGVLYRLGINRGHAGDYASSEQLLNEAIKLYQRLGASSGIANAQRILAQNQVRLGETESSLALMRQVISISQASGDRVQTMLDLRTLALLMGWNGLYEDAYPLFQQALSLAEGLGNRYEITFINGVLGIFEQMDGQYILSHCHLAVSLELGRRDGFQREVAASLFSAGCTTLVEKTPQEAWPFFQESIALYRQVGHQDELSCALSLDAFCSLALGEAEQARLCLVEALNVASSIRGYGSALYALAVSAVWLGDQGESSKALEIYELVAQKPLFINSAWFHEVFGKSIEAHASGLPWEIATAARERGRTKDLFEAVAELAEELKT